MNTDVSWHQMLGNRGAFSTETWFATPDPIQGPNADRRLQRHLQAWLGAWPPARELELVAWSGRDRPGWDGGTWSGLGVESPDGTVLSLSPTLFVDPHAVDPDRVLAALHAPDAATAVPAALGRPDLTLSCATFRWSERPAALPDIGEWTVAEDPRLPAWLRRFNDDVLVAWDDGQIAAGVGIKRHNYHGHELAVVTEPAYQGRGLARLLVAQAARRVLTDGAVPLYLHEPANAGSARVADAAGFPDRGWRVFGLLPVIYPIPQHEYSIKVEQQHYEQA